MSFINHEGSKFYSEMGESITLGFSSFETAMYQFINLILPHDETQYFAYDYELNRKLFREEYTPRRAAERILEENGYRQVWVKQ